MDKDSSQNIQDYDVELITGGEPPSKPEPAMIHYTLFPDQVHDEIKNLFGTEFPLTLNNIHTLNDQMFAKRGALERDYGAWLSKFVDYSIYTEQIEGIIIAVEVLRNMPFNKPYMNHLATELYMKSLDELIFNHMKRYFGVED